MELKHQGRGTVTGFADRCLQTEHSSDFISDAQLRDIIHDHIRTVEELRKKQKVFQDAFREENDRFQKYKMLYEKEVDQHRKTQGKLGMLKEQLANSEAEYQQLRETKEIQLSQIKRLLNEEFDALVRAQEAEIIGKQKEVEEMKRKVSESFTGNSFQRQHYIEDLTKEIKQLQEQANELRITKRQLASTKTDMRSCCKSMTMRIQQAEKQLSLRAGQIDILESRLSQSEKDA